MVALVALAGLPCADAQQTAGIARIGYVGTDLDRGPRLLMEAFLRGLRELGYVDGRSVKIEYRDAAGKLERLPALADELVALKVDVIFAPGTQHVQAARQATTTIPIVFADVDDPVARGFVASLARPGGNITGLANLNTDLIGKWLELLKRRRVAELAAKNRLPANYPMAEFVDAGGFMSYSPNIADNFRRAAGYVDKILKGARPADLPVEQSSKFELVINLKTANALGLTIPPSLSQRADRVIE